MIRKIHNLIILFFLLSGCGYNPIFSEGSKFSLTSINLEGDKTINRVIYGKLYSFSENKNAGKKYKLRVKSISSKKIASKDTKGNLDKFNLNVIVTLQLEDINKNVIEKSFSKNITYNNMANKFDLSKYERSAKNNFAEKISEEIIIFIQSLE